MKGKRDVNWNNLIAVPIVCLLSLNFCPPAIAATLAAEGTSTVLWKPEDGREVRH